MDIMSALGTRPPPQESDLAFCRRFSCPFDECILVGPPVDVELSPTASQRTAHRTHQESHNDVKQVT